jgi:hypothetical protein
MTEPEQPQPEQPAEPAATAATAPSAEESPPSREAPADAVAAEHAVVSREVWAAAPEPLPEPAAESESEVEAEFEAEDVEPEGALAKPVGTAVASGAATAAARPKGGRSFKSEAAPTPSEVAVRIQDRASQIFVGAVVAVFAGILLYGLILGSGGLLTPRPTPRPTPVATPASSAAPSASAAPSVSPAPSGSEAPSPSVAPSVSAAPSSSP